MRNGINVYTSAFAGMRACVCVYTCGAYAHVCVFVHVRVTLCANAMHT